MTKVARLDRVFEDRMKSLSLSCDGPMTDSVRIDSISLSPLTSFRHLPELRERLVRLQIGVDNLLDDLVGVLMRPASSVATGRSKSQRVLSKCRKRRHAIRPKRLKLPRSRLHRRDRQLLVMSPEPR